MLLFKLQYSERLNFLKIKHNFRIKKPRQKRISNQFQMLCNIIIFNLLKICFGLNPYLKFFKIFILLNSEKAFTYLIKYIIKVLV